MLSIGGEILFDNTITDKTTCNKSWPVIRALDTSTYKWLDEYAPGIEDYYIPDQVVSIIGGNGKEGAKLTAPTAGFTDPLLSGIFAQIVKAYTPPVLSMAIANTTGSTTSGSASGSATATTSSSSSVGSTSASSSHTAAIAGGAAGGAVALALIAGLACFFCLRHRRRARDSQPGHLHNNDASEQLSEADGKTLPASPPPAEMPAGYHAAEVGVDFQGVEMAGDGSSGTLIDRSVGGRVVLEGALGKVETGSKGAMLSVRPG